MKYDLFSEDLFQWRKSEKEESSQPLSPKSPDFEEKEDFLSIPSPFPSQPEDQLLSVEGFIAYINEILDETSGILRVYGEISGVNARDRYAFFTLKDSSGSPYAIDCFAGWTYYDKCRHLLQDGLEVVIIGKAGIYKNGRFRLEVREVEARGEGALRKAFEALKKKLEGKGYFSEERKRPLPSIVTKLGLITSASGAAINDFRKNLGEYGFTIRFIDVMVEGMYAEASLISALQEMNLLAPDLDAIILIRGGGSLESLQAFNSEALAEAIISSRIPVVTGIGHERDVSIADFVADRHFSTPTAVAAFFRIAREELLAWIENQGVMLENGMLARFNGMEESLAHTREDMIFAFGRIVERANFRISRAAHSISSILARVFNSFRTLEKSFLTALFQFEAGMREERHFIGIQARKIEHLFETLLIFSKGRMDLLQNTIEELNPEKILARGYSIVHRKQNNKILSDAEEATIGEELVIRFHRNRLISVVKEKE